jgi:uncharacterized protein (DUF1499 family)
MPRRHRRGRRWLRLMLLWLVLVVAVAALAARLYFGRDAEDQLRAGEKVDFAHLDLPSRGNAYLVCPADPLICNLTADEASPVFTLDPARLRDRWLEMVSAEPRVHRVSAEKDRLHVVVIQHSFFLRFPDIITVEFLPSGNGGSTVAMLSRSRYGESDFGVNAARVGAWIAKLKAVTESGGKP